MIARSNIIWFSVFIFLVLVAAGVFFLRILPVIREARSLSSQLESMIVQRRELVSRPGGPPSEPLLRAAREATARKEEMLKDLEKEISIEVPRLLPEGIVRPSIYWLDTLRRKRPEITSRAGQAKLSIPAGLGFDDALPPDEDVPKLLFRLHIVENLIDKAAASGLRSISALTFGETGKAGGMEAFGIEKIPLRFTVGASLETLFSFIHSLRGGSYIYVIDDMKFKTVERERVESRRPDPRARTRRQDPDMHMDMHTMDVPETRIRERFLEVEVKVSMYYVSPGDAPAVPSEAPSNGERDFAPEEAPGAVFDDSVERSRILR